ncbi:MAG: peroxidase-related enzyme [Paracoccaceae bacterium]|nr:peroxidase-related enzyme [Paracoccaceae bacterium]
MTDRSDRASWLRIPNVASPAPAIAAMWEESKARLGYVREFLKMPFEPERLALFQGYVNRLMRSDDCALPGHERELISLVVSLENRCEACIITHAGALQAHGMEKHTVDVLLANWRRAEISGREHALAGFASKLTIDPGMACEADMNGLREAGLSENEILETVQIVAIFNATNRLNSGLGIKVDGGAFDAFRA